MARSTTAGSLAGGQGGVVLLALLIAIAALGAGLAAAGTFWHQSRQRSLEAELLFVGLQYRNAIRQYYEAPPGGVYPPSLEALLVDPRSPAIRRYLRRPYRDPLTGSAQWGLVQAPQGGIMGVYSLSPGKPIKQANFPAVLEWAPNLASFADWKFVYLPAPAGTITPR
ncbi:type II secretion system protein [Dechloromonas sp. XY25]|uniref:Type II secretion system protein n=1 Tax=Dechloromonas hankyongensis TaxID=2908002 RepID=A0ABS9K633_9RHOO|nr:type II secretion system protein [Dechloromonas hankyongensis]MCG2578640.1 type II secretion system protein [Dechloromonas hankyongensis]